MPSFSFLKFNSFRFPSRRQWTQFFKLLNRKEKYFLYVCLALFASSAIYLYSDHYYANTTVVPKDGGRIKEGFVGQPQFINPLLYFHSEEIDKSLIELMFSGLMSYDENGGIVPDMMDKYEFKDGGKTLEFSIKENLKWQDGQPLTIDDVAFTIGLVQDSRYFSDFRLNWQQIEIEKISATAGRLKLKQPYAGLLENLATLKILPKHSWDPAAQIQPQNFASTVGSGPYKVKQVKQNKDKNLIDSIILERNPNYCGKKPYLDEIEFVFFSQKDQLIKALKSGQIKSALLESYKDYSQKQFKSFDLKELQTPGYFAVFFNTNEKIFSEKDVREAFALATDRNEIIQQALDQKRAAVSSPILPEFYGFAGPDSVPGLDLEKAKSLLIGQDFILQDGRMVKTVEKLPKFQLKNDLIVGSKGTEVEKLQECLATDKDVYPSGKITGEFGQETKAAVISFQEKYKDEILTPSNLTKGNGKVGAGTRAKLNELCWPSPTDVTPLSFTLTTFDSPDMTEVAKVIKTQWEKIGAEVVIKTVTSTQEIYKITQERNFQALLFGETLSSIPDPLPFWHSLQAIDPGLNLTGYDNKKADELLEQAKKYYNANDPERIKALEQFQNIVIEDSPAILLYDQKYFYLADRSIKGVGVKKIVETAKRFSGVSNWYVQTQRIWNEK